MQIQLKNHKGTAEKNGRKSSGVATKISLPEENKTGDLFK